MTQPLFEQLKSAALLCGYQLLQLGEVGGAQELVAIPWLGGAFSTEKLISALADALAIQPTGVHGPSDTHYGRTLYVLNRLPDQFAVHVMPRYATFRIVQPDPAAPLT